MTRERVPAPVRSFLAAHVRSLAELETLVLLLHNAGQWWTAESVADELGISVSSAGAALEGLARRNLLDVRLAEEVCFQYRPASREQDEAVRDLDRTYAAHRAAVAALVGAPPLDDVRAFADAFRIRKKEDEDG
jgi:hypothetical protein